MTRRALLSLTGGFLVSGCATTPLTLASKTLDRAIFGYPGVPLSRKKIDAMPYASMAAKIGSGPRSLVVLGSIGGDQLTWVSADRVALVTRSGRIVESAGLPENLVGTAFLQPDPLGDLLKAGGAGRAVERLVSLVPPDEYELPVASRFTQLGPETIEIVELRFQTMRFLEHCVCKDVGWKFTNHYWADSRTGFIWKSRQHIHPDVPVIEYEILKPARI